MPFFDKILSFTPLCKDFFTTQFTSCRRMIIFAITE